MYDQQDNPIRKEFSPPMGNREETVERVRVYERPKRPVMPVWLLLLLIAVGMLLIWFLIQSL